MRLIFLALIIFPLISSSAWSDEPNPTPTPAPWPSQIFSRIGRDLSDDWADETTRLSASLFDDIANIQLFSVGGSDVQVGPRVRRQVFDNRDLHETFSVVDTMRLPATFRLWSGANIPFTGANLSLNLGAELYLQTVNIRQVKNKEISNLEAPPEVVENRLRNLRRARYGRLWNLVLTPFRIPLTEQALERMEIGEISSWLLGGTLSLSGSFGWGNIDVIGANLLQLSTGFTTYIAGSFRVSAFKLKQDKVRLKVTRERKHGLSVGVGESRLDYTLFKGFVIFDHTVATINESIIPFSFQTSWENAKSFDVIYDYDLSKEEAKRAYFLATQGRLERSHELAQDEKSGVTHILSRDYRGRRRLSRAQMKLSLLFQKQSAESWSLGQATITTPDGIHKIFEAQNINVRSFDTLWGAREERRYQFQTTLDEEYSWPANQRVLNIRLEARDNNFSGHELNDLLQEIDAVLPIDFELPAPPIYSEKKKVARYGRGSAFLEMDLSGQDLVRFLTIEDESEQWSLLEQAYNQAQGEWSMRRKRFWWTLERLVLTMGNLPLRLADVHFKAGGSLWNAWQVKRDWRLAIKQHQKEKPLKLAERLGRLFRERYYNRELTKLIVMASEPEVTTPTILDLSVPKAFTRIRKVSGDFPPDDILRNINRDLNFDQVGPRQDLDPALTFQETKLERLDNGSLRLRFKIDKPAYFLHWHIERRQSFGRRSTLMREQHAAPINQPFGAGSVEIIIRPVSNNIDPFYDELSRQLDQEFPIAIRISASSDGEAWGEVTELHLDPRRDDD